jgi:hypothetical protein
LILNSERRTPPRKSKLVEILSYALREGVWESEIIAQHILKLGSRWSKWLVSLSGHLAPVERSPGTH